MIINSLGLAATLIAVVDARGSRFGFAWVRKHDTVLVDYTFYYYEHISFTSYISILIHHHHIYRLPPRDIIYHTNNIHQSSLLNLEVWPIPRELQWQRPHW